jgi:putative endonuclease
MGSINYLARRLVDHNAGNTPTTRPFRPWLLLYKEEFPSLNESRRRERTIKSWKNPGYMLKTLGIEAGNT